MHHFLWAGRSLQIASGILKQLWADLGRTEKGTLLYNLPVTATDHDHALSLFPSLMVTGELNTEDYSSGAVKVWKQKEIHKKKILKVMLQPLNWTEMFGTLLYWDKTYWTNCGRMEAEGGSEVTLRGFKRWRWWPGGQPRGRTAPAGRRWRRRGWALTTWGQPWSCRPPGRLPAQPPDGPDARRGRDTWRGERKEGQESRGSKIRRQEEKGYGREVLF